MGATVTILKRIPSSTFVRWEPYYSCEKNNFRFQYRIVIKKIIRFSLTKVRFVDQSSGATPRRNSLRNNGAIGNVQFNYTCNSFSMPLVVETNNVLQRTATK